MNLLEEFKKNPGFVYRIGNDYYYIGKWRLFKVSPCPKICDFIYLNIVFTTSYMSLCIDSILRIVKVPDSSCWAQEIRCH